MKRLAYVFLAVSMLTFPLTACGSKEADAEDLQDSIDFELDNKTQVEAPTLDTPQYSVEDNTEDSLDDLLGSPQVEDSSNEAVPPEDSSNETSVQVETSNNNSDVNDILNLLEQTIDTNNTEQQTETTEQQTEPTEQSNEPTTSITVNETSNIPQQSTQRKVPNTGIYPD